MTCWIFGGDHLKKECPKKGQGKNNYAQHCDQCDKENQN
jgi:hypothetical protein